jgi:HAD superfamily phosphoserine phosphatase-like hydrolase
MSIFLDFDGTITAKDTIGVLSKFALQVRAAEGQDLEEEWAGVVKAYMEDLDEQVDGYHVEESARCLPEHEVEFLREMKTVELKSLERLNRCQVFKGISKETFQEAGRDAVEKGVVKLRPGFRHFVDSKVAEGWKIWVISVNWSTAFIEGAVDCPAITVIANRVQDDGSVIGPEILNRDGQEPRNLTNSCDKLDTMKSILEEESLLSKPSFYFGDSTTDLECLLAASHGVVISDKEDSKLLETLRRIGKEVPHGTKLEGKHELSWASTYDEVMDNVRFQL